MSNYGIMASYLNNIKIILHNVLCWTFNRRNELSNYYIKENPDVILLNSTGCKDDSKIKIFGYNVHQKNTLAENHAGIAIAVRRNLTYQLMDDIPGDILAIRIETGKGPIVIVTTYLPPRRHYVPEAEFRDLLNKNIPVY